MYKKGLILIYCATYNDLVKLQWCLKPINAFRNLKNCIDDHAHKIDSLLRRRCLELLPFPSWEDNSDRIINWISCVWLIYYKCIYDKLLYELYAWITNYDFPSASWLIIRCICHNNSDQLQNESRNETCHSRHLLPVFANIVLDPLIEALYDLIIEFNGG